MSCIKTMKSKCVVIERLLVESENLGFYEIGLILRIMAYDKEKLNLKEFSHKYNLTEDHLQEKIKGLERKGYIISVEKPND